MPAYRFEIREATIDEALYYRRTIRALSDEAAKTQADRLYNEHAPDATYRYILYKGEHPVHEHVGAKL